MSQAFLIDVSDDKQGVIYPAVIGPFPDVETAGDFAQKYRLGTDWGGEGGYHAYHIISDTTCDYTPEKYAEEYQWVLEDDEQDSGTD